MNVQLATNMWNVDITTLLFINAGFAGYDDLKIIATQFFFFPLSLSFTHRDMIYTVCPGSSDPIYTGHYFLDIWYYC